MKSKLFFLVFSLCFNNSVSCQETISSVSDSIKKYISNNPEKTIIYSHKFLELNKTSNNPENIILGYSLLAFSHEAISQIDSTLYFYHKSLSLVTKPADIIEYKYFIARIHDNNYDYNDALRLYGQIIDLGKKENDSSVVKDIKLSIELLKVKVGLNRNGLSKKTFDYLKETYNEVKRDSNYLVLRYTRKKLIEVYLNRKNINEATTLINEGMAEAKLKNNVLFLYYMYEFRSRCHLLLKDQNAAKKEAVKAMDYAVKLKNKEFINEINYSLANISFINGKYEQALVNIKDVLKSNLDKSSLQASKYYKLTAKIYKKLDSIRLSNTFYSQYIEEKDKVSQEFLNAVESIHDITLKEELSNIQNSYEEELKEEIFEKEKQKKTKWIWTSVSAILLAIMIGILLFFKNKSMKNQKRFDSLMVKINAFEERKIEESKLTEDKKVIKELAIEEELVSIPENKKAIEEEVNKGEHQEEEVEATYTIDDKKVEEILMKIQKLEEKNYFLRQDCTMHNMSKKLKTNTSYLSKIINTHLNKSFSTYINELRINHAILELKNNKRMRSYSVKGIAEEMGYKNADAFSRYFRAATGITPSVYIKKIQEI